MIIARVVKRRPPSFWGRGERWSRPVAADGAVTLYRCRRYADGTVDVQASTAKTTAERDDLLVELTPRAFETLLTQSGLKTDDDFGAELTLTVTWRVSDPQLFLGELSYQMLREHGRVSAEQATALLQRQCRTPLALAVGGLHYTELRERSDKALTALEDALRKGAGAVLEIVTVVISALLSPDGEAHLAAEAQTKAKWHEATAAIAAAQAEAARIEAETAIVRAQGKRDKERLRSRLNSTAIRRADVSANGSAGGTRRPRDVLAQLAKDGACRIPGVAIERAGLSAHADPRHGLPIALIGQPVLFHVTSADYGFVTLIVNGSSGRSQLLAPNAKLAAKDAFLRPDQHIEIPWQQLASWTDDEIVQRGPEGAEDVLVFLSQEELFTEDELGETMRSKGYLSDAALGRIVQRLSNAPLEHWSASFMAYYVSQRISRDQEAADE